MLQSIAIWLLKDYVGEYIENLNTDQLTIGYGGVELEQLILKKTALRSLKLPIKVSSGYIGKLNLVIPYANPNTQPWVIKIEDLFLSVEPETEIPEDVAAEEKERKKEKMLERLEAEWKANMQNSNTVGSWWSSGTWFSSIYSSLSTKIMENLQLVIKNVHLRYVNSSSTSNPFSFGVKIGYLSAETTNMDWEKSTQPKTSEKKFKLVELNELSVYHDEKILPLDEFDEHLHTVNYILQPVSAEARVCRNASKTPLSEKEGPRFDINVLFDNVGIELSNEQYKIITDISEEFSRYFRAKQNKKWRPLVSVHENPKAWWRFAIQTVQVTIKDKLKRQRKDFIMKNVGFVNIYIPLYLSRLLEERMEADDMKSLEEIERACDFEQIAALRKIVFSKITSTASSRKLIEKESSAPAQQSWTAWAMSYIPYTGAQDQNNEVEMKMSKEEEKFLQELSESYSQEEESLYKRDSIFTRIAFSLKTGSLLLKKKKNESDSTVQQETLLDVAFNNVNLTAEVLLKSKYFEWKASLGSLSVKSLDNEETMKFPALFQPQETHKDFGDRSFLEIVVGKKRSLYKTDFSLSVTLQPSTLVYRPLILTEVKKFFSIQDNSRHKLNINSMSSRIRQAISSRIEDLKNATKTELANVVGGLVKGHTQKEDQWNVNLDIAAPRIIIPLHADQMDKEVADNMVVVNLGRITFCNERAKAVLEAEDTTVVDGEEESDDDEFLTPSSTPPGEFSTMEKSMLALCETLPAEEIREKFYDSYTLELSMVQILVCELRQASMLSQLKGFGPDHVVEEFSVSCLLKRRIVFTTDPELPALILTTVLPQLLVHVDEKKLQALYTCFNLFTRKSSTLQPVSKEEELLAEVKLRRSNTIDVLDINTEDLLVESKLFMAKFMFEKLSLGLHSRGRCFAELQLKGIECEVTKRPYDMSVSFILSSLLLIDAIQTFGAEYELLVSSTDPMVPTSNSDVLISVCYEMISADCPTLDDSEKTPLHILSVNFNSLFMNGNLETIVELKNVINQLVPKRNNTIQKTSTTHQPERSEVLEGPAPKRLKQRVEISATFKELDILLFRVIYNDGERLPSKIAKVCVSSLELISKSDVMNSINGCIGSISVTNMSPSLCYNKGQKTVFMVGMATEEVPTSPYDLEPVKAFTFDLRKNPHEHKLEVHMASAYYIHNPRFLAEILLYVGDYRQYALNLARSIQVAASDMAKSMVMQTRTYSGSTQRFVSFDNTTAEIELQESASNDKQWRQSADPKMQFDVCIESPVVVFPGSDEIAEFIVGHLGKISVRNHSSTPEYLLEKDTVLDNHETFIVEIEKINLSVLNTNICEQNDKSSLLNVLDILQNHSENQTSILHNTDLYLKLEKIPPNSRQPPQYRQQQTIKVIGQINSTLRLFLSMSIYRQILSTLKYSTSISTSNLSNPILQNTSPPLSAVSSESSFILDDTSPSSLEETSPHNVEQEPNNILAEFKMPCLQMELHGELHGKSCGFVLIEFSELDVSFTNTSHPFSTTTIILQNFSIEDLLHGNQDKFRYLISSAVATQRPTPSSLGRPSSSYPGERGILNVNQLSTSLPNIFNEDEDVSIVTPDSDGIGRRRGRSQGPFISLKITTTAKPDEDISDGLTKAKRRIAVDISDLDMVINLQTWVILLEFFGIGVQTPDSSPTPSNDTSQEELSLDTEKAASVPQPSASTDLNINIKSLVFFFNKELYPLAKASLSTMGLHVILEDGNQDVTGTIGKIALMDLSPYQGLYEIRLLSSGDKAVDFTFFRFGKPDPNLQRTHDMDLVLTMSALQYVHTQHFLMEVIAFCQHFVFLQEVLARMRAANAGREVAAAVNRAARLNLRVNADAPILILPRKSTSPDLLVANLGKLSVENEFLYASDPTTNGFKFCANRSRHGINEDGNDSTDEEQRSIRGTDRLLDCIKITLCDMEIYSGMKLESRREKITYVAQGEQMMVNPCSLHLTLERNLEWMFGRQVPDMSITGSLSSVSVNLDLSQYSLIMGMLGENLGEKLDVFTAPSTVIVDPLILRSPTKQVWTTLHIHLHLSDVTLETVPSFSFGPFHDLSSFEGKLGKFDFLNSVFVFESFSDSSKSINLVSTDVLLHDIRDEGKTGILLPCPKTERRHSNYLQFEVHYLDTKQQSTVTFLCNQSRILLQFEFLLQTWNFLARTEENKLTNKGKIAKSPELVSQTVLTKSSLNTNTQIAAPPKKQFELKVNITESELVLVEDITSPDSWTVILKTTAVCFYRPDHSSERPLSCSLQSLEIFSCLLSQPDDSALSIVDPVAFLVELIKSKKHEKSSTGLYDAVTRKPTLEIQFQVPVKVRVSYHDVQMFQQIMTSAQKQVANALNNSKNNESADNYEDKELSNENDKPTERKRRKISPLTTDKNKMQVKIPSRNTKPPTAKPDNTSPSRPISGFDVKTALVSLTIIDDCGDNDVPLLDLRFSKISLRHEYILDWHGSAECHLDALYYNTRVSAWEPFLESWKFNVCWFKSMEKGEMEKLNFKLDAPDRLDMNLTSALVDITKTTANLWSSRMKEDHLNKEKKRAPFQPFVLRNRTGVNLSFSTSRMSPKNSKNLSSMRNRHVGESMFDHEVESGTEIPFTFEHRTKQRHQATHSLMVHQISIQLPGWLQMQAITVDRVGRFYRIAKSVDDGIYNQAQSADDIFILIDIELEGARKVITVHSALTILNELSVAVELMGSLKDKDECLCILSPKEEYHVPVMLLQSRLYVRPFREIPTYQFCNDDLCWRETLRREEKSFTRECKTNSPSLNSFKFTAVVQSLGIRQFDQSVDIVETLHAEHYITLLHTVLLENQLPFDLFYTLKGVAMKELVKPGSAAPLSVNIAPGEEIDIGFSFENFPRFDSIKISNEPRNYVHPVRLYDLRDRVLLLNAFIKYKCGAIQVSISAPFWLVNKTGLPLVFKREEDTQEVAGQFDEHEEARSLTPLPFSFVSSEYSFTIQMRVGKDYLPNEGMSPLWCRPFSFEKEFDNRTLYVRHAKDKLEKSFDIGIVNKWGKGVFKRTKIVTFVPRFQIDNRTDQIITVAQVNSINTSDKMASEELDCYPGVVTIFHWNPKWDRILCGRLHDDVYSAWSGGFRIDKETTYYLTIKSSRKAATASFRVHVTLKNGTYRCTFMNAVNFPPPFRIVNLSDVTLFYWQTESENPSMREFVRAKEMKDYIMDEPLKPASITFSVYQESSEKYDMTQRGKHFNKLYYQNAIFIAFKETFPSEEQARSPSHLRTQASSGQKQLVLDVIDERHIVLATKAEHKLSQLWRMSAEGHLIPFTPATQGESRKSRTTSKTLALDIEKVHSSNGQSCYILVLNQIDHKRINTQTWFFEGNRLKCCMPDHVVQGKSGLKIDTLAILGKCDENDATSIKNCTIFRQKLRPGSGVLSVRVYGIGPTQVVEVSDSQQEMDESSWIFVNRSSQAGVCESMYHSNKFSQTTEVNLSLVGGFGISLINLQPEEVIFATLSQIRLQVEINPLSYDIKARIGRLQVDNQLFGCEQPVALFSSASIQSSQKSSSSKAVSASTGDRKDVRIACKIEKDESYNLTVVKKLYIDVAKLYINLEDRLLLKLIQTVQTLLVAHDVSPATEIQNLFDSHRVEEFEKEIVQKMFFEDTRIIQGDMVVSLLATGAIDEDLLPIKKNLGLIFASFDAAAIVFESYNRTNVFETMSTLQASVLQHYVQTFKNQITTLLGSLDILGNPVGLIQDFSSGVEGLLKKGNVGGLLMNVAHGMSDSAAKMTGVIANGIRTASGQSTDARDMKRVARTGSSSSHVSAGLRGFGKGMLGGITSIIVEPIEGASKKGLGGFITGVGKGLIGTVAKPVAGVLDLASGTAAAVRTSTETSISLPPVVRSKRNCYGPGGVLEKFSRHASDGQEILRMFNEGDPHEMFVSMETIRPNSDRLKALLTDKGIYIVRSGPPDPENIELHIVYGLFLEALPMVEDRQHYIEIFYYPVKPCLGMKNKDKRIPIRCDNERLAKKVSHKANYLKLLHEESQFIQPRRITNT